MKAYITVGVSASGKSTWADELQKKLAGRVVRIERDMIRSQLIFERKGLRTEGYPNGSVLWEQYNWKWEADVSRIVDELIATAVAEQKSIIISDTNLNVLRLAGLKDRLIALGFEIQVQEFHVSWDEATKRDTARSNGVGTSVLARQFEQYYDMWEGGYHPASGLPHAVIFDVDGTLARKGDRSPFDWDKVDVDTLIKPVANILRSMCECGFYIIITSGRDSVCREKTAQWLEDHNLPFHELYMRPEGDMRKDAIIKREIFDNHIRDRFHVESVFDDRPQVCRMWRSLGLNVLQIGNPYIEF